MSCDEPRRTAPAGVLLVALGAIALVLVLVPLAARPPLLGPAALWPLWADLAEWLPLLAAALVGGRLWVRAAGPVSGGSLAAVLGARLRPSDLGWGLLLAVGARAVDALLAFALYGTADGGGAAIIGTDDLPSVLLLVVGTGVVTPIIEELFFRGLLQRWLLVRLGGARWGGGAALVATASVFALLHLVVGGAQGSPAVQVVGTTLVLGTLTGLAAVITGRIGAAVVGHVLFNLAGIALLYR
ncbi:MAG: CPBP family intramembrane metalloprotease [Micrococcales bacterium]|nr:CPBP family intramembrane metalloprotease [Micrococcales bacterium]